MHFIVAIRRADAAEWRSHGSRAGDAWAGQAEGAVGEGAAAMDTDEEEERAAEAEQICEAQAAARAARAADQGAARREDIGAEGAGARKRGRDDAGGTGRVEPGEGAAAKMRRVAGAAMSETRRAAGAAVGAVGYVWGLMRGKRGGDGHGGEDEGAERRRRAGDG